jgi:hypothetical protein
MPLARYILCVGGALLSLLFISDAYLPKMPVSDGGNSRSAIIHIHSDQKWPERIVYDTSLPTVVPAQRANIEANVAAPENAAAATEREAFAQLQPSSQLPDAKKREPKLQRQRKIAKKRAPPPALFAARQVQFSWFGNRMW